MENEGKPAGAAAVEVEAEAADAHEDGAEMLLELVLAQSEAQEAEAALVPVLPERIDGILVGTLAALGERGELVVTFAGAPDGGFAARSMPALGAPDVGCEVALMFEGGDPRRPVVLGRMHVPEGGRPEARADGGRVELSAEKELVLRCGKASITLTRAGKILIRGAYLLARSSGVNRIQGGSVQIN